MKDTSHVGRWTFPTTREEAHEQIRKALKEAADKTKRIKEEREYVRNCKRV